MTNSMDSKPASNGDHHLTLVERRARIPASVKRILVPTDLTEKSQKTIEFGLALAQRFGAHLTLLHVYKQSYAVQFVRGPNSSDEGVEGSNAFRRHPEIMGGKRKRTLRRL